MKTPLYFKHNFVSSVATYLNGKLVPANPLKLNFRNSDFLDDYHYI